MENKFKLSHLALYAKGWYYKSEDIWQDLIKVLELDNYTPFSKSDVFHIITNRFSEFDYRLTELREVLSGIQPKECWKVGYYTKGNYFTSNPEELPEYDMETAFIYYVLSTLRFLENTQWNVVTPDYSSLKMGKNITKKKVKEHFESKI
jgi:hypothetical protein